MLPLPAYPVEMLRQGVSGFAKVEFRIEKDGRVRDVHAVADSLDAFVPSAIAAVEKWTFEPPVDRKTSQPATQNMRAQFAFTACPDDDVSRLMPAFTRTRLSGSKVLQLALEAVQHAGIDLSRYPGVFAPSPYVLYPAVSLHEGRDGRLRWLVSWSRWTDDQHSENLPIWIDDQSSATQRQKPSELLHESPFFAPAVEPKFTVSLCLRAPRGSRLRFVPLVLPLPAYPCDLARAGLGEDVEVSFTIRPDGVVTDAKVTVSSRSPREFADATARAMDQWRFLPAGDEASGANGTKMRGHLFFQPSPEDYGYARTPTEPAFAHARLSGREVTRFALARARPQASDLPYELDIGIDVYGTREGANTTGDDAVNWVVHGLLSKRDIGIDDRTGATGVEIAR
jgi:TonB family protein